MMSKIRHLARISFFVCLFICQACDNSSTGQKTVEKNNSDSQQSASVVTELPEPVDTPASSPIMFEKNKNYLFDVSDHTIEEMEALLLRAEEVTQADPENFTDLEIVMILHGSDIDWFTSRNYQENKKLIDLAARLDKYDIIDMKVCETTMLSRGVSRDEIPDFIESVPFAPTEINTLTSQGYINL